MLCTVVQKVSFVSVDAHIGIVIVMVLGVDRPLQGRTYTHHSTEEEFFVEPVYVDVCLFSLNIHVCVCVRVSLLLSQLMGSDKDPSWRGIMAVIYTTLFFFSCTLVLFHFPPMPLLVKLFSLFISLYTTNFSLFSLLIFHQWLCRQSEERCNSNENTNGQL